MKENLEAKREGGSTSLMGKVYQEKGPKDTHYSFGACLFLFVGKRNMDGHFIPHLVELVELGQFLWLVCLV